MKDNKVELPPHIKSKTKEMHGVIKETTNLISNSQWSPFLQTPPPTEPNNHFKKASAGSVPTTPLHAALGPASAAAVPNMIRAQPKVNFFERVDNIRSGPFQNNSFRRPG
jgi:hypothetical protein